MTLQNTVPTDLGSWWSTRRSPLAGLVTGGLKRRTLAIEEIGVISRAALRLTSRGAAGC